jgi:hypothetical protein
MTAIALTTLLPVVYGNGLRFFLEPAYRIHNIGGTGAPYLDFEMWVFAQSANPSLYSNPSPTTASS